MRQTEKPEAMAAGEGSSHAAVRRLSWHSEQ